MKGYTDLYLRPQINKNIQELIDNGKLEIPDEPLNYNNSPVTLYTYSGISFKYKNDWKITNKELQEDLAYQVNCEKMGLNSSETISITWTNIVMDSQEMIKNTIAGMKEEVIYKNSHIQPIVYKYYNGVNAVSADFDFVLFGDKYFGRIISFNKKGKTLLIVKQTDKIEKLETEFKIIEDSIDFKSSRR